MTKRRIAFLLIVAIVQALMAGTANAGTAYAATGTATAPAAAVAGNTYYVDAAVGDDTGDGSSAHPWKTIGKAASVMTAGDTAKIRSGVYRETVRPASDGVTFEADAGADVTVSGADLVSGTWSAASEVPAEGVYKTDASLNMGDYLNQVYVDGAANNWARSPNTEVGNLYDPNLYEYDNTKSDFNKLVDNSNLNQPAGTWDGAAVYYEDAGAWNFGSAIVASSTPGTLNILTSPSYYAVRLSSLDNKLKLVNQNGTELGSANAAVALNTVYHVKVEAADGLINVYLNDGATPAITATDPNPIEGFFELGVQSGNASAAASAAFTNVNAAISSQDINQAVGKEKAVFASNIEGWSRGDDNGYWKVEGTSLIGCTQPQISQMSTSYHSASKAKNFTFSADVTLKTAGTASMTFRKQDLPYVLGMADWGLHNSEYFIMGKLAALDYPGEWFYDKNAGRLYLKTTTGDDPSNHTVEVKARNLAFDLADRSNIVIKGLKLFAATIDTANGENNVIDGIHAKYVTDYYVQFGNTSGICLCGKNNTLKNSEIAFSSGSLVSLKGEGNKVINNVIHDAGYGGIVFQSAIEVWGVGHLISNNTVYNSTRQLIGGQFYASSIQYNDFYSGNAFATDTGLLYTAHSDLGNSEIHHNYWHDNIRRSKGIGDSGQWSGGVYVDNGTYNALIYDNLTWGFPWRGIMVNYVSNFVQVYNNTTHDASIVEITKAGYTKDVYKDKVYNNITVDGLDTSGVSQGADYQANLTAGDPLFADAANKDFRLSAGSPALDAGIPIAGVTPPGDSAPDIGAFQTGEAPWKVGADLVDPPAEEPTLQLIHTGYRNLLVNGPFELDRMGQPYMDGLYGWTRTYSQTAQPVVDIGGGAKASHIGTFNGVSLGTGEDGIEQTITSLKPNTKYEVRGFLRSGVAGKSVRMGVKDYGGSDMSGETAEESWQEKIFTFTTGAESTSATIYAYKPYTGAYAFIDDFSVTEYQEPPALPPAPSHPEPGTLSINDTVTGTGSNQFAYTGTWETQAGNEFNYHNDNHHSAAADDYYEVKFDGVQIELYSELQDGMGIVGVSIDGGAETMVDTYSRTHVGNALVYTSPRLADGTHTMKVRVTGTKNPSSSGFNHAADRVIVISAAAPIRINDSETGTGTNRFLFSDGWTATANNTNYGSDNHFTMTPDSFYEVKFNGVQAKLYSEVDAVMGIAGVSIDGGPEFMVDLYSPKHIGSKLVFTTPKMPDGAHTIKVRVTGKKNALASGTWIVADRVDAVSANTPTVVNDSQTGTGNNRFDFHGTWWSNPSNPSGYAEDVHFTNEADAYYEVHFIGKGFQLYSELSGGFGIMAVTIDGGTETTIDMNAAVHMGDTLVYTSPVLADGPHTLKVRNTGTNSEGGGPWIVADRVDVIPTGIPDTEAPGRPGNLTAPTVTGVSADLTWDGSTDNYGVEVYEVYDGSELIGLTQGTSYTVTGLTEGQSYTFTVKAKDAADNRSPASSPVQVTAHAPLPNLALNKPAAESSEYAAGFEGSMAFDGDPGTRWAAAEGSADPQWVSVDLGEVVKVGHVKLNWSNPHGTAYQIQVSVDGTDWTDVYAATSGDGGSDDIGFTAADARYVRLLVSARSDAYWGASLNEMEVYRDSGSTPPPASANLALNKPVTESSKYDEGFEGGQANDGDTATRWAAQAFTSDPQWIRIDLGTTAAIDRVVLNWSVPFASAYAIQVSTDGTAWKDVYSTASGAGGAEELTFPAANARYVRLYTASSDPGSYGISLNEIEVYGEIVTPPPDRAAPTTTSARSAEPNEAGWNRTDVTVTLQAADEEGGSGVKRIVYSAAGAQTIGETAVDGSSGSVTLSAEGATTLSYYAVDGAGNAEAARTLQVNIDKTGPNVQTSGGGTYDVDQTVRITCTASDSVSGLAADPCTAPLTDAPAYRLGLGAHAAAVSVTDNAGNVTELSIDYKVKVTLEGLLKLIRQWVSGPGAAGIVQSLTVKLGQPADAFVQEVSALSGKKMEEDRARTLIELFKAWKEQTP